MVQIEKFSKKKAKKVAAASARHSSEREERQDVASVAGIPAPERHGEELEVRETVGPPRFSPIVDDISLPEELTPTPEDVASDISSNVDELPVFSAEDGPSVGAKRSRIFPTLPIHQTLLQHPTSRSWTLPITPQMLTNMLRQQGSRRAHELSVAAELMVLL